MQSALGIPDSTQSLCVSAPLRESFCFLEEYEGTRTPAVSGHQLLRQLCSENAISGAALSKILGASRLLGSMLLRGDRNIEQFK